MANERLHKFASQRMTKWSRRQLPGYWPALQVVCFVGFGLFLAVRLIGGGPDVPPTVAAPAPGTTAPAPAPASTAPASPAITTPDPVATTPAAPDTGDGPTVNVVDMSGAAVAVPEGATAVATSGLRALFDPSVAATVPSASGGTVPAPARAFPGATIGGLVLYSQEPSKVVFTAATDADGAGAAFAPADYTITVVLVDGVWAVGTNG